MTYTFTPPLLDMAGAECVIALLLQPGFEQQARYNTIHWAEFRGMRPLGNYGEEV